jgi:hypothetical protein
MAVTYSKEAIADAKKNGLHLVKVELNGKHAKKATMSLAAACGPETAKKVQELVEHLCDVNKRMQ